MRDVELFQEGLAIDFKSFNYGKISGLGKLRCHNLVWRKRN